MEKDYNEKLLMWKSNKLRVVRVYNLYKESKRLNPSVVSQEWFDKNYELLMTLYEVHKEVSYIVMTISQMLFVNDAEYRINDWYIHQMENN